MPIFFIRTRHVLGLAHPRRPSTHPRASKERITTMPSETDRARPLYGALAGLLTGAVAVGVGQLVASIGAQNSSPFVAVGDAAIGLAPEPVKSFAITEFGSHDKPVLLIGIGVVLAIFVAGIGVLAARRLVY